MNIQRQIIQLLIQYGFQRERHSKHLIYTRIRTRRDGQQLVQKYIMSVNPNGCRARENMMAQLRRKNEEMREWLMDT